MFTETEKTTSAKLYIFIGVGARDLYIDEAHTALDIFRFAAFFLVVLAFGIGFGVWYHWHTIIDVKCYGFSSNIT